MQSLDRVTLELLSCNVQAICLDKRHQKYVSNHRLHKTSLCSNYNLLPNFLILT